MPTRIQRQRRAGWRMPEGAVVVSRPTVWGNPFPASPGGNGHATHLYRRWLAGYHPVHDARRAEILRRLPELKGKPLACWCALEDPCHADVLIELANAAATEEPS